MISRQVVVRIPGGIHAAVAHCLSQEADRFRSSVFLSFGGRTASLTSMIAVLALGVPAGEVVELRADGLDEEDAAAAVVAALEGGAVGETGDPREGRAFRASVRNSLRASRGSSSHG